jgi:hypothetical protein
MPIIQIEHYLRRVKKSTTPKSGQKPSWKKQNKEHVTVQAFSTTGDRLKLITRADGSTIFEVAFPKQGF